LQYQATNAWTGLDRSFEGLGLQASGKSSVFNAQQVTWVAGMDADHAQEQRQAGAAAAGEKSGALTRNELNEASNRDYFAQANWSVGDRFTLTTGARQSNVTLKSRDDMPSGVDGSGSVTYKATSPVLGLTWHAQDNLNLYINQGKGFETPTMVEAAYSRDSGNAFVEKFNPNLQASRSKHLELAPNGCHRPARASMRRGSKSTPPMKSSRPWRQMAKPPTTTPHKPSVMVLSWHCVTSTPHTGARRPPPHG
jgi:iron complex outermembrane receptor protein